MIEEKSCTSLIDTVPDSIKIAESALTDEDQSVHQHASFMVIRTVCDPEVRPVGPVTWGNWIAFVPPLNPPEAPLKPWFAVPVKS